MYLKRTAIALILLISLPVISQNDSLNRYDSNNEKTGWWKVYLDAELGETTDSSEFVYFRYAYFKGKFNYYSMSRIGTKKNPVIAPAFVSQLHSEVEALDGEYKANYSSGQTRFVLIAQQGKLLEYKEYYDNGNLMTHFDYTASCGDTKFHYCIYQFKKDGSLKSKGTIVTP